MKNKLKNLILKTLNEVNKRELNEGSYPRVANILRGVVPSVNTLGLITGENPYGKLSPDFNNNELINDLKRMNLGFIKVVGQYGSKENSLLVPNIQYDELLALGEKYKQESVIYGEKVTEKKDGENYTGMEFQMIRTDDNFGDVISKRNVFINDNDVDDYYSIVKGRKFYIPFFDDKYVDVDFKKGSGVIKKDGLDEKTINLLEKTSNKVFEKGRTNQSKWLNRGVIKNKLNEMY